MQIKPGMMHVQQMFHGVGPQSGAGFELLTYVLVASHHGWSCLVGSGTL
jgi:hypothetical protein